MATYNGSDYNSDNYAGNSPGITPLESQAVIYVYQNVGSSAWQWLLNLAPKFIPEDAVIYVYQNVYQPWAGFVGGTYGTGGSYNSRGY